MLKRSEVPGGRYKRGGLAATRGDEIGIQVVKGLLAPRSPAQPGGCRRPDRRMRLPGSRTGNEPGENYRPGSRSADYDLRDDDQPFLFVRSPIDRRRNRQDPGRMVRGDDRRRLRDDVPHPDGRERFPPRPGLGKSAQGLCFHGNDGRNVAANYKSPAKTWTSSAWRATAGPMKRSRRESSRMRSSPSRRINTRDSRTGSASGKKSSSTRMTA